MRITKMRRNAKALSPIFAVLILIAIAVIAGIIVYMFTSGYLGTMMGGGTAGQEKVAVETVTVNATTNSFTVYCKSTGGGPVIITEAILKDAAGLTLEVVDVTDVTLAAAGTMGQVPGTCATADIVAGNTYTLTLVSQAGNQFVSPAFKA